MRVDPNVAALPYKQVSRSASASLPSSLVNLKTPCGQRVILREAEKKRRNRFAARKAWRGIEWRRVWKVALGTWVACDAVYSDAVELVVEVNAAVPVEAYDPAGGVTESSRARLTPSDWVGYPQRLRAAGWHELVPEGDARRGLTWKGRFANVSDTVNYYSPEDEVLMCGNGEYHLPYQREYAWYCQERYKGVKSSLQNAIDYGRNEGGWAFNPAYDVEESEIIQNPPGSPQPTQTITWNRHATVDEMTNVTDMALIATPFFGPFADNAICSTNGPVVVSPVLRAQLLADAIPAESLPAGLSEVTDWNSSPKRNCNMSELKDNINLIDANLRLWKHSYFLQVPYMIVHGLFEDIVNKVKE